VKISKKKNEQNEHGEIQSFIHCRAYLLPLALTPARNTYVSIK